MPKVLIVEDDRFLSKAYTSKLKKTGFEVILAFNGKEALEKSKLEKPDIILLDLLMPKKNGWTVLADLKKNRALKNIPVIVLSNLGEEDDIKKARGFGAADYLVKSDISIQEVINKIKKFLAKEN